MIRCVILDFDGTIANTEQWGLNIYNELARKYSYKTYTLEEYEQMKGMPLGKILPNMGIPYAKIISLLAEGQKILKKHMNDIESYHDNVAGILKELKDICGMSGIVSSNTKHNIRRFLRNKEITGIDFIASSPLFSKESKIMRIVSRYGFKKNEVLYVGDEARDIHSAHKAGIKSAAACWGYNDRSVLEAERPDYIIDSFEQLLDIAKLENKTGG